MFKRNKINIKDVLSVIGGLAVAAGVLYVGYKAYKYGEEYLQEILVEDDDIPEPVKKIFIAHDTVGEVEKKLREIEKLILSSNKNESHAGLMLMCATFERIMAKKYFEISGEKGSKTRKPLGMVDVSRSLRSLNAIERDEHEKIVKICEELRNPLFHGEFEKIPDEVPLDTFVFMKTMVNKFEVKNI